MMTIITEVTIQEGQEPQWDQAYEERLADVPGQPGWVSMQLLIPVDGPNKRVVLGTWRSRADWEAWHVTKTFLRTRERMNAVEHSRDFERWYEVVHHASTEA